MPPNDEPYPDPYKHLTNPRGCPTCALRLRDVRAIDPRARPKRVFCPTCRQPFITYVLPITTKEDTSNDNK